MLVAVVDKKYIIISKPKSMPNRDAPMKSSKSTPNKTGKASSADGSRKPRSIVAESKTVVDTTAEDNEIKDMDLFFPILTDAITNFFNTFTGEPQKKPKKPKKTRTTTEKPEDEEEEEAETEEPAEEEAE